MRIGIVLTASYWTGLGAVMRVRGLVSALSQMGHEVHVLAPFMHADLTRLPNVTVHRIGSPLKYNKLSLRFLARFQDSRFFWRNYMLRGGLEKISNLLAKELSEVAQDLDLDVLQGEQEIAAFACCLLGQKLGLPTVSSLHNIAAEELVARGIIVPSESQYQLLVDLVRRIVTSSSRTIVVSDEMKEFLVNKYLVDGKKITVAPLISQLRTKEVTFIPRPNKVVYAGLASKLDSPWLFVKSIPFVTSQLNGGEFYMTELGEELPIIKRYVKREHIPLNFFWYDDTASFFSFLITCHVGIVTSANHITRKFGCAMKFFDYLSAGVPVVANDIGGWTRIIREERVGLLCGSSPIALAEAVLYLLNNPEIRYELAENALRLANTRFSVTTIAKQLSNELYTWKKLA